MDRTALAYAVADDGIAAHEADLDSLVRLVDLDDPTEHRLFALVLDEASSSASRERGLGRLLVLLEARVEPPRHAHHSFQWMIESGSGRAAGLNSVPLV